MFLFRGLAIGTCSYLGADSATITKLYVREGHVVETGDGTVLQLGEWSAANLDHLRRLSRYIERIGTDDSCQGRQHCIGNLT
jgi:hypothetical protein